VTHNAMARRFIPIGMRAVAKAPARLDASRFAAFEPKFAGATRNKAGVLASTPALFSLRGVLSTVRR